MGRPFGAQSRADACAEVPTTCHVTCERTVLMQIIKGELEATNAIVGGQVVVDDLGQLMAFKMAFKLERAAFEEYMREQREGGGEGAG